MATDVIIFFVGLTLWSQQVPNDCGVKAILPRVEHTASEGPHVQHHTAALVFHAESYVSQFGWGEPASLPSNPAFKFVRLDGDHVRFLTHGTDNGAAALAENMSLPRLRQLCPGATLGPDFQAPYTGAAAVVALSGGAPQACLSVPAESQGRLDTRLRLTTTDTLVIASTTQSGAKELRLKPLQGSIALMVANLPGPFFDGVSGSISTDAIDSAPHMNAYYDMVVPSSTASCALSLQDWWDQLDPGGIPLCNAATSTAGESIAALAAGPIAPSGGGSTTTIGANFECSNNQWP